VALSLPTVVTQLASKCNQIDPKCPCKLGGRFSVKLTVKGGNVCMVNVGGNRGIFREN